MPVTPNKKFEVIQRRQKVADFYVQGWTQTAIAAEVDVSQPTICEDLQQIRQQWKESAVRDFDEARDIQLQKLDRLEREAWERSQKPTQSSVISGRGGNKSERRSLKNQHGDPSTNSTRSRPDLSQRLSIPHATLQYWRRKGWVHARQLRPDGGRWIFWADADELERLRRLRACPLSRNPYGQPYPADLMTPKPRATVQ